jgi:flavin reductase (DIM6/NTAB) family NADH-FMN oxidoreductase RutF
VYKPISPGEYHVLHPRPVYLIVARSSSGKLNVMAASWVTPVSDEPFLVAISVWKGSLTHQYIRETGEFTVNIPSEKHVNIVFKAGSVSGRDVDKLALLGLKTTPSSTINTPGLEDMLGFLECKVVKEVDLGESTLFIAEVKAIHVKEDLYTKYGWDLSKARILLHHSGRGFTTTSRLILAEK